MTGRIEKTVFISYRRTNFPWALNIYQDLTYHGYDVFFDYQSIDSGDFEEIILDNIKARAHFIVVLTPSALEKCKEPNDWLRREIETAVDEKRNIVPLMMEGFDFGNSLGIQALTGKLATLSSKNGLPIYAAYFFEGMEKLRNRYLNIALSNVPLKPLTSDVQEATETQKVAASEAPPVEMVQLTAQEWFEKGYVFQQANSPDEAIRCYNEAIRLRADFAEAYYHRGVARRTKLLAALGGILIVGGFGIFMYFILSFMAMVFGSFGSFDPPDSASLNFGLVWIGIGALFVGMILFVLCGGMEVMRMIIRRSARK